MIENFSPCINIKVFFLFISPKYSVSPINLIYFLKTSLLIGIVTKSYLVAASKCLFNDTFNYKNEIYGDFSASLEFVVIIQGIHINGVDLIGWNANQEITSFKVMIRPLKAVNLVRELMTHQLKRAAQQQSKVSQTSLIQVYALLSAKK